MTTLAEIKTLYPDIDINTGGGADSYQEDVVIVERDPIAVVIKHPDEDVYLIAKWKNADWSGFLTGGIEDGDTLEDTVKKEIHEETGYKNISNITSMDCVTHGLFFHTVKKVNRLAHYHLVFAQLSDLEKDEVSEDELAISDFVWIKENEVASLLTRRDMQLLWQYYIEHK